MRSPQVLLLRGGEPLRGIIVPDPDGAGFSFVPEAGGPLPAGDYQLLLRSRADGFVNLRGQLLDGDYDGAAGGDYRATFKVQGVGSLLADALPAADRAAAPLQREHRHRAAARRRGGRRGRPAELAARRCRRRVDADGQPGPWGSAVPQRAAPGGAARRTQGAEPIRIRTEPGAALPDMRLARRNAGWVQDWVDAQAAAAATTGASASDRPDPRR